MLSLVYHVQAENKAKEVPKMCKVFVEYKVKPEYRETYLVWIKEMTRKDGRFTVYEGTEQPGLFVEMWDGLERDEYLKMKEQRLTTASSEGENDDRWGRLTGWVEGGVSKIHMWHFTKVHSG
jgi:hypothetical protein